MFHDTVNYNIGFSALVILGFRVMHCYTACTINFSSNFKKSFYHIRVRTKQLNFITKLLKVIRIHQYRNNCLEWTCVHMNCMVLTQYLLNCSYYPRAPCQVTTPDVSIPVCAGTVYCPQDTCGGARPLCPSHLGTPTLLSRYTCHF